MTISASIQIRGGSTAKCYFVGATGDCPRPTGNPDRDYMTFGAFEPRGATSSANTIYRSSTIFNQMDLASGTLKNTLKDTNSAASITSLILDATTGRARRWGSHYLYAQVRRPSARFTVNVRVGSAFTAGEAVSQPATGATGIIIADNTTTLDILITSTALFNGTNIIQNAGVTKTTTGTGAAIIDVFASEMDLMDAENGTLARIPGDFARTTAHDFTTLLSASSKLAIGATGSTFATFSADQHHGFWGCIQFGTKGGMATHLATLGQTHEQFIANILLYPHLILERYHPIYGTMRAQATCLFLFGKVTDSAGVEKRPDVPTFLVPGDKLVDAVAGYTMTLTQDAAGTPNHATTPWTAATAAVWQYPPYSSPSARGDEFDLDFAQGNQTFVVGPGQFITTGTVYGADVDPVAEVRWHDGTMARTRWPRQVIGGWKAYVNGATSTTGRTTRPFASGKDYHYRPSIVMLNDGTIIVDHCGHNATSTSAPVPATYTAFDQHCFTRYTPEDFTFTIPTFVDAGGLIGGADTPGGQPNDFAASQTTYCHTARPNNINCAISTHRARDTANGFVVLRRTSAATAVTFTLTTNDGTGIFPHGNLPLPGGHMLITYEPRVSAGPMRGLRGIIGAGLDADSRFQTIGTYYKVDGTVLAAPPNNNDSTLAMNAYAAGDSYVSGMPLVAANGDVIWAWGTQTAGVTNSVYPSDGICTSRSISVLKGGYNPALFTWNVGYVTADISNIIAGKTTPFATWYKEETVATVNSSAATLGSMWQTPVLQWLDQERTKVLVLWADPAGTQIERENTTPDASYGTGTAWPGPAYPFQRAYGRRIHAWVMDDPFGAPGTLRYLGVIYNMDTLYGTWSAGKPHCCKPLPYLPGYQGSPLVCIEVITEVPSTISLKSSKYAGAVRKYINVADAFPQAFGAVKSRKVIVVE